MKINLFFPSILMFCFANSSMALPMLEDDLFENVIQEQTIDLLGDLSNNLWLQIKPFMRVNIIEPNNISKPDGSRNSDVFRELSQTDSTLDKNLKQQIIQQPEDSSQEFSSHEIPTQETPLRELLKYYKTLVKPDKQVLPKSDSSANPVSKALHAGKPIILLPIFTDELEKLINTYAISTESFNVLRNIFGDNTELLVKESGDLVNLGSKLNPITIDDYAVANSSLGLVPQYAIADQSLDWSAVEPLSFQHLIKKYLNVILHPVSVIIFLFIFFFILPVFFVIRRGAY